MPSLAQLSKSIDSYRRGELSLDQFADWFEDVSLGMFGESPDVLAACLAIEAAFSRLRFEGIAESEFRKELENAIRPFALQRSSRAILVYYGEASKRHLAASPSGAFWFATSDVAASDVRGFQNIVQNVVSASARTVVVEKESKETASATVFVLPLAVAV
jgi:hypothetical protein